MFVIGKDAPSVGPQGLGKVLEHANAGRFGPCDPVLQMGLGIHLVRQRPQESEIFLHVVCRSQRFVDAQGLFQPSPFIAVIPEVFRILQKQPASAFEDVLLGKVSSFPVQITPQLGEFLVEELDHVKMIEHDGRTRQVGAYRSDVGLGHVHCNRFDAGSGRFESFPERVEGINAFAFTHEDNGSTVQIEHHRQVSMSVTNADLIDGNPFQATQRRAGESAAQMLPQDLFDGMPIDSHMTSHVRHGHVSGEFQHVSLEAFRVSPARFGKADRYLSSQPTSQTEHPLDRKFDDRWSESNGERPEPPKNRPFLHDLSTPTSRTPEGRWILTNPKNRLSLLEASMNIVDSTSCNPETVVQYPCGHDFLAFSDFFQIPKKAESMSFFTFQPDTLLREDPLFYERIAPIHMG